ncbi:MAG: DUF4261 domain-containing protein [Firmicutes bacterium]|nr:DUF4261 domain-containing protein [Bacillota bacterium]
MAFFKKKKKTLQQDLSGPAEQQGMVFLVHLLMEEKCILPDKDVMDNIMRKYLGNVECFSYDETMAGFAANEYTTCFEKEDSNVPAQLLITECTEIKKPIMDEISYSQTWDCPESDEILKSCRYHVVATDLLAAGLHYKDRAEMLVKYVEALVEMFPTCEAVVFETSKKMLPRETIINCDLPIESRFIYYAVNVRFFNIQDSDDMLVDSLGMSTLFMPDLQYHFHSMDPNFVVNHAYNVLSYLYDAENPLKSGDRIDGIKEGEMSMDVQWKVQYENALIQPVREVIDFNMGEYAAGTRQQ